MHRSPSAIRRLLRLAGRSAVLVGALLLLAGSTVTAPLSAAAPTQDELVRRVVDLTNAERQRAGMGPLALNPQLQGAAQGYAEVLAVGPCFGHTCGPVADLRERVGQAGYTGWSGLAENVAGGQPTPEAVVAGWLDSPGHRANMLNPSYAEIGVGIATGPARYRTYWTQVFGTRPGASLALQSLPPPAADPPAPAAGASGPPSSEDPGVPPAGDAGQPSADEPGPAPGEEEAPPEEAAEPEPDMPEGEGF